MPSHGQAFSFLDSQLDAGTFGTRCPHLVYVGHRPDTHPWWHQRFAKGIGAEAVTVIDIHEPSLRSADHLGFRQVHGDVLALGFGPGPGLIFWDEGPEHVSRQACLDWVSRVLSETEWDLLLSCPWGFQEQAWGPSGNPHEEHLWGPMPEDFLELGLHVRTFGMMFPAGHGNLIAWTDRRSGR